MKSHIERQIKFLSEVVEKRKYICYESIKSIARIETLKKVLKTPVLELKPFEKYILTIWFNHGDIYKRIT